MLNINSFKVGIVAFPTSKNLVRLLTGIVVLCFFAACGNKSESAGMGPLADIVFMGSVDGWSGSMDKGVYSLTNEADDPNAIRYFFTESGDENGGRRSVSVDVKTAEMGSDARAGLLYGYRESPKFYYLVVASSSGEIGIYKRDDSGFGLSSSTSIEMGDDDSVRLELNEKGRELTVVANGRTISTIENDNVGKGRLGIAAFGLGRFGFTNYVQTPAAETPSAKTTSKQPERRENIAQNQKREGLIMLEFKDPSMGGMVMFTAPYPEGWKIDSNPNDQLSMTGPGKIMAYENMSAQFTYSNDPFSRQIAQSSGAQMAPPMHIEQFLNQRFGPYMKEKGFDMTDSYQLPKIQDFWDLYSMGLPQGMNKRSFIVIGADWKGANGFKACTVLVMTTLEKYDYVRWWVLSGELFAPESEFENAKDAYLHAGAMTELNPRWQIATNNRLLESIRASKEHWDGQMRQIQIQHINRMNAIAERGKTSSSVAQINSDILDISHSGFLKRSNMVSSGQAKEVNMLSGQSVITNASTGEMFQVETQPGNYWVGSNAEYFSTENVQYDPNTDNSMNSQGWTLFEVKQ
ncbi:hypothetical protein [Candidatus Nitrotoga sp. M5]|uniref:hypothetical protein n=1 Tax=Candidatus Nitrotoga sp. M5 TaxID=2890409 RepID=UPI001EF23693|nr:hypothetical protein [Candidatus Nitrotoga sp. M5]CAH1386667.1 hypothetical protein NTGM5_300016 [Candidatus Nitrotoga sp. M5]